MTTAAASTAIATLGAAVVFGLSAGLSPGPLLALTISQSLRHGAREGIKVALAPLLTDGPIILASCFLLARFSSCTPVLGALTIAGAVFVCYLAWENLHTPKPGPAPAEAGSHSLRRGYIVNALSPHPYLFWFTVGAPMVLGAWPRSHATGVLFPVCFLGSLVGAKILVAVVTGRSRAILTDRTYAVIMKLLGAMLFVFAAMLLCQGLGMLGVAVCRWQH